MFIILYTVNLYICVFMTCSTSYCIYDTLIDPWNVHMCVCTYVCMYRISRPIHVIWEKFEHYHSSNTGDYQFKKQGIFYLEILIYIFMRANT